MMLLFLSAIKSNHSAVWSSEKGQIEVSSQGGLPSGLSETDYYKGNVSILRDPILGNVFFRLHIVEILGTGIVRINEAYKNSNRKPAFDIYENSITVILPVINNLDLTEDEAIVYEVLSKTLPKLISEMAGAVSFGKPKTTMLLKRLGEKKVVMINRQRK